MNHPAHVKKPKRPYRLYLFVSVGVLVATSIIVARWTMPNALSSHSHHRIDLLASGWNYLSGVSPQSDGLHVEYVGGAIVQQDGSPGQRNPALNLYGTHLTASGDFDLNATISQRQGSATISLYASPPIIQDEFRVEPPSLSLQLTDTHLTITRQAGYTDQDLYHQVPATSISYPLATASSVMLSVERRGPHVDVIADGKHLATLPNPFTKDVWFGLSADQPTSHWTLSSLQASGSTAASSHTQTATTVPQPAGPLLQTLATAKRPGFLIGAAMALGPAVSDSHYSSLAFGGNFGSMTPENAMKWQFIHPQPGLYDFKAADALVDIALKNHLQIHGHTLVFGEANPAWVQQLPHATPADKAAIQQVMIDHITQTVHHFKGRVSSWDVVNEPLADDDDGPPLRQDIWEQAMGPGYIATAFASAHAADPTARLYLNEYGLEADGQRWDNLLALVSTLKAQGTPIDGIGMQAHVYEAGDAIDPAILRTHIRALAALGLTTRISEMDVYSDDGTAVQATQYAAVLEACLDEPSCVSWSTWGVTDRYDLYQDDSNRLAHGTDFLWDSSAAPTPALHALQHLLK